MHIHYTVYAMDYINVRKLLKEQKTTCQNTFRTWIMTTVQKVLFICHPGAVSHQSCLSLLYVSSNVCVVILNINWIIVIPKPKALYFCNHLSRNKFPTTLYHK